MRELSDKELEDEYRDLKMTDIPDMWESIERNLAPKKPKKVIPIRTIASLAAVVAVVLLLAPVVRSIRQSEDMADANSAAENSVNSATSNDSWGETEQQTNEQAQAEEDTEEEQEESGQGTAEHSEALEEQSQVTLTVLIQQVQEADNGLLILAEVTEAEDSGYQPGEQLHISYEYDEKAYQKEDFQGTLRLRLQKEEENLKLLEILP